MSQADKLFKRQLAEIITSDYDDSDYSVRPVWEDGTPAHTKYITHSINTWHPEWGVPIQTGRKIAWKSALREVLAIYQRHATTKQEFHDMGVFWWDSWFDDNNSLGKSYSYQLKKKIKFPEGEMTQFDRVLYLLENKPMDRRIITNMLNLEEMVDMTLPACAFMTIWSVRGEYLDLMLIQRSGDTIPAAGFGGINTIQYYFLQAMVAQVTGYKIGKFTHVVNNIHIYDRHIPIAGELLNTKEYESPKLWVNPDIKDFYDFAVDDIKLIDYEYDLDIRNIPIAI